MLKSELRDQKRDRKVAKIRRASPRQARFVLQYAAAKRLGLLHIDRKTIKSGLT